MKKIYLILFCLLSTPAISSEWSEYLIYAENSLGAPYPSPVQDFRARLSFTPSWTPPNLNSNDGGYYAKKMYLEIFNVSAESACPSVSIKQGQRHYEMFKSMNYVQAESKCWIEISSRNTIVHLTNAYPGRDLLSYDQLPVRLREGEQKLSMTLSLTYPHSIMNAFEFQLY